MPPKVESRLNLGVTLVNYIIPFFRDAAIGYCDTARGLAGDDIRGCGECRRDARRAAWISVDSNH